MKRIAGLLVPATAKQTRDCGCLTQPVNVAWVATRPHSGALLYKRRLHLLFQVVMAATAHFWETLHAEAALAATARSAERQLLAAIGAVQFRRAASGRPVHKFIRDQVPQRVDIVRTP